MLSAIAEKEATDRASQQVLNELTKALDDPYAECPWRKKADVWRVVKQLQRKRKLHSLRNKFGKVIFDADAMAARISAFWQTTMQSQGESTERCKEYLSQFFQGKNVPLMAQMLIKPLSLELVEAAPEGLSRNSAPGTDGFTASIYVALRSFFAPLMLSIFQDILQTGQLNPFWAEAMLNPIPRALGCVGVGDLRPLVLQNLCHKWVAAIVALQLQDLICAITRNQQRGFIKGRYIQTTLWDAFSTWSALPEGLFCPIDFRKAFDSVTHAYASAFFELLSLPPTHVRLLLALFSAPIVPLIKGQLF